MKRSLIVLGILAALAGLAFACSQTDECPVDGSVGVKVDEQYANGHVIAKYEHQLMDGSYHRWIVRCQ